MSIVPEKWIEAVFEDLGTVLLKNDEDQQIRFNEILTGHNTQDLLILVDLFGRLHFTKAINLKGYLINSREALKEREEFQRECWDIEKDPQPEIKI